MRSADLTEKRIKNTKDTPITFVDFDRLASNSNLVLIVLHYLYC